MKKIMLSVAIALAVAACAMTPEQSARLMAFGQAMQGAGASMRGAETVSAAPNFGMTCFKAGEQVSGFYRNCIYRCGTGVVAQTVGAAELCPISIEH